MGQNSVSRQTRRVIGEKVNPQITTHLTKPVKFIVIYQTKKVSYFLSKKDKIPDLERNDRVYEFSCPGCSATYIGKTVRNLQTRFTEHAKLNASAVSEHLTTCKHACQTHSRLTQSLRQRQ